MSALLRFSVTISRLPAASSRMSFTLSRTPYTVMSPAIASASSTFTFSLLTVNVPGRFTSPMTEIL